MSPTRVFSPRLMAMLLRPMESGDLEAVARLAFTLGPHPWTKGMFAEEMAYGSFCQVLEPTEDGVAGFIAVRPQADEWHLMNVGVARERQRGGWGRRMVAEALAHARARGGGLMLLEVRMSNQPARGLYEAMGFAVRGRRKHYYPGPPNRREDALIMARRLDGADGGSRG